MDRISLYKPLDPATLRIKGGVYLEPMNKIFQQGVDVGLKGVPTVLFNGRVVASGARTVDCFGRFIEAAL